jgi:GT2 family glycosyltransferase
MTEKIGVVVLNYTVAKLAVKAVESVLNSSYKNIHIYLVDNSSNDGLEELVKEKFKDEDQLTTLFLKDNTGYTGGNNAGIKLALKDECSWVMLFNPDAVVEKDTIEIMHKRAIANSAHIINPKIYFADSKIIWFAGKDFDKLNVLGHHRGVDEEDSGKYDTEEELEDGTGCALLIKNEVFEKIGFLDEQYFLYYEESDFIYRARAKGFKVMYIPSAIVYHENAKSSGVGSPLQDYFITRNRMLFAKKFLPFRTQFALFREALRTSFKYPTRRLALTDFLMGRLGKGSFIKD